nr:uncharacterized protein LOC109159029 [Ipomoea batatas]
MGYIAAESTRRVSGQQQISSVVEEKNRVSKVKHSSKFQDKYDYPFGHADSSKHHEVPKNAVNKNMVQLNSSADCQKQRLGSKADNDEELVKHMSNLPKYLQRTELDKNVRAKALNFGVIDWNHLEKWKYNERMPPTRGHRKVASSSGGDSFSVAGRPPKAYGSSPQHKNKHKHTRPHGPFPSLSHEQKLMEPVKHSMHGQDFWTAPSSTLDGQHKNVHSKPTSRRSYSETNFDKDIKKVSDNKTKSGKDDLFSDQFKNDRRNAQDGRSRIKADSQVNPTTTQNCATEPQNIVILIPKAKHSPKTKCMETSQVSESRTISNEDTAEPEKNRYSDTCSSQESYSRELYPIPHSCPLPSSESGMKQHESYAQGVNSDLFTCRHQGEIPTTPTQVQAKCLRDQKSSVQSLDSVEMSQMDLDLVEQQAVKGRHPSPIRRLSFSLGRMSRSFSFKETSAVSQSSDAHTVHKSGPVSSGVCDSPIVGGGNREKANASGKGRSSSPMWRLFDPLLRSKGIHSAETSKPQNENLNSMTLKPASSNEHLCEKKHQPSTLGALLQLTIKDGLPSFKFVVDKSNDILVAAVKQLPKSGKVDECLIYSFYTVSEIKKKSGGWMSQGSKGKCSGFGYNLIGLMKVSSSSVLNSNFEDSKDGSIVRESILYSVNLGQVDKQAPAFLPDREIAAIMVRNQIVNSDNQCNQHFPGDSNSKDNDKNPGNIIAILPGGVHGLPQKGAPSSLIERWKSGGLCDCGGWDVGCKLQVLTEQEKNCNNQDRIALYLQGGEHERKPFFSLAPMKNGLHSVQFDQSTPLLEAFSICVAILTSQKLCSMLVIDPLEQKFISDTVRETDTTNASTAVQGQGPARYVPSPPPSPVARI